MREERIGQLRIRLAGGTDGRGGGEGPAVVLLHGWAAPGDDLVSLADVIDAPQGTRFFFPEGPLTLNLGFGDARAWWRINEQKLQEDFAADRPRNLSREVPRGLAEAREHIVSFLSEAKERLSVDPGRMVLGGFSQGAMLAFDVALRTDLPFAGLAFLSGTVMARDEWLSLMPKRKGLRMLQSHGSADPVLPNFLAEQLRDLLVDAGVQVEWVGFGGGHEISASVLTRLGSFLHAVLGR